MTVARASFLPTYASTTSSAPAGPRLDPEPDPRAQPNGQRAGVRRLTPTPTPTPTLTPTLTQTPSPSPSPTLTRYDGKENSAQSKEYNAKLRLYTMRHAMTAVLRSPPAGFEDAVEAHFSAQRDRVLQQCWAWAEEAPADMRDKMLGALHALHAALPPCTGDGASSGLPSDTGGASSTPGSSGPSAAGTSGAEAGSAGAPPRPISSSKFRDGVELSGAAGGGGTDDELYDHEVYD